jgi:hypothetical protein
VGDLFRFQAAFIAATFMSQSWGSGNSRPPRVVVALHAALALHVDKWGRACRVSIVSETPAKGALRRHQMH